MHEVVSLEGIPGRNFKIGPKNCLKSGPKNGQSIELPPWSPFCSVVSASAGWKVSLLGSPPPEYPVDHVGSGATPASVPTQRTAFRDTQSGLVAFVEFWVAI